MIHKCKAKMSGYTKGIGKGNLLVYSLAYSNARQ